LGTALIAFAGYLTLFETVVWSFSPELLVRGLPIIVFGAGVYVVWNTQSDRRLRHHIARMNPDELRNISAVLIPTAGLLALLTVIMGNFAQFFFAGLLVVLGFLNLWRAAQTQVARRL
ncbi:MAG: hypothetical protein H7Y11_15675, partial [Armatimonadetes bacterium]|nr:hypothetical protein [Anaerolineae bacterium]